MGKIQILDESVSNIIAAGEVVENPASMIKELIENSLDAESSMIKIYVKNSGRYVKITDTGTGMSKEDMFLSIERHATSKIKNKEDIFNLYTYGFRGEALASIASVSKLALTSRRKEDSVATKLHINGGRVNKAEESANQVGTEIEVKDLFYNTPARLKFLRTKGTEYSKIKNVVLTEALANYNVAFSLYLDDKEVIKTSGKGIKNTILELFSPQVLRNLKEFEHGFIGNMNVLRASKDYIFTYINGRYAKSAIIEKAVIDAYYTKLMKGKYPFCIIFLKIDPREIDVNVHPSKKIVKFSNDTRIYSVVKNSVEEALYEEDRENSPVFQLREEITEEGEALIEDRESIPDFLKKDDDINKKTKGKDSMKEYNTFEEEVLKVDKQKIPGLVKEETNISYQKKSLAEEEKKDSDYIKSKQNEDEEVIDRSSIEVSEGTEIEKESKIREETEEKVEKAEKAEKAEKNTEAAVKKDTEDYRIIGQLRNMYILVERKNELEIYDQHIVHERILYEELKEKHYNENIGVQNLLVPIKVEVDYKEKELIDDNRALFQEFGYEIEDFGPKEILIRTTPIFDFRASIKETFYYILNKIAEGDTKDFREKIIVSMSCKNAIKAGEPLKADEMAILLDKLHKYGKYTCPHGRPIIIKLSYNDLDKMFGRK